MKDVFSAVQRRQDLIWFIWRTNERIKAIEMENEGEGRESIRYEWWVERNQDQGQMEKKTNGCKRTSTERQKMKTFNATFTDDLKPHSIVRYIIQFYNNEVILCNYKKYIFLFILVYKFTMNTWHVIRLMSQTLCIDARIWQSGSLPIDI